jgi:hypothetical protein
LRFITRFDNLGNLDYPSCHIEDFIMYNLVKKKERKKERN